MAYDCSLLCLMAPELTLMLGALALLVIGAVVGEKSSGFITVLAGIVLAGGAFAASVAPHGPAFGGAFVSDAVSSYVKIAMYLSAIIAAFLTQAYFGKKGEARFEFAVLIILATLGMSIMVSSGDLMSLYIGVELQSLALYVLAAADRDDPRASEAGLKYFVLGALSSGLLLYGISLIYGFAGSLNFAEIAHSAAGAGGVGVIFGLVFLLAGLAFKVSAAPFHMWTPDVYEGAPTPIVAFFAGAPKFAALILIARTVNAAFGPVHDAWAQVLQAIAVLSFLVGAFGGVMQRDVKRLLAYSSIANMGYALLALSAGTQDGVLAVLVFMVLYTIDGLGFFAVLQALSRDGKPITKIDDFAGLVRVRPGLALAVTAFSLSMLGMPPFSGFWGKLFVFKAAIANGDWIWASVGLLSSVVAAFYYLRLLKVMWFDAPTGQTDAPAITPRTVGLTAAAFSFAGVWFALIAIYPAAQAAAAAFFEK